MPGLFLKDFHCKISGLAGDLFHPSLERLNLLEGAFSRECDLGDLRESPSSSGSATGPPQSLITDGV